MYYAYPYLYVCFQIYQTLLSSSFVQIRIILHGIMLAMDAYIPHLHITNILLKDSPIVIEIHIIGR